MLVSVGGREYAVAEGAIYGLLGNSAAFVNALEATPVVVSNHALALLPRFERERAVAGLEQLRRQGRTVMLASHDEALLERLADEIWWVEDTALRERGVPEAVLPAYRAHVALKLRAGEPETPLLAPSARRGDGRASIDAVELTGENGQPTAIWSSGERVTVAIRVRFHTDVPDPVIGMLIRTRVGLNVYGTNTQLEGTGFGPVPAGHVVTIRFAFACHLCPGEYTITLASHDPDGAAHEWLDDAVAFSVTDFRYTAGVANLRAVCTVSQNI